MTTYTVIQRIDGKVSTLLNCNKNIKYNNLIEEIKKRHELNFNTINEEIMIDYTYYNENVEINMENVKNMIIVNKQKRTEISSKLNEFITVPSQYDENYKEEENYCTWFTMEMGKNATIIKELWNTNKIQYIKKYSEVMFRAIKLRKMNKKFIHGENIDEMPESNKLKINSYMIGSIELFQQIPELKKLVIKQNVNNTEKEYLEEQLKKSEDGTVFIVNRYGQSFVAIKNIDVYILCDSHTRTCGTITSEKLYRYISDGKGTNYIIWSDMTSLVDK